MGAFIMAPLPPMLAKTRCAARPLRSTGITPLRHYYGPNRHRLAVSRFPGVAGYTAHRLLDGTRTVSPVARHVLATVLSLPPRRSVLPPRSAHGRPCCLRPEPEGSASGFYFWSRPPVGSLALRPGDSLTIPRMALSIGFLRFVSSTDAIQATGLLTIALVGLTPTEHASLCWTH